MNSSTTRSRRAGRPPTIKAQTGWREWTVRFRNHMAHHGLTQTKLGIEMGKRRPDGKPLSQATIGHWLTGRNEISLADFMTLCDVAGANPIQILFHRELLGALAELVNAAAAKGKDGGHVSTEPLSKILSEIPESS